MSADFRVKNGLFVTENAKIQSTTDATSATDSAAAVYTAGGVAVSKKLYVGTNLDVQGTTNLVGDVVLTGDLAVNGGDITTTSTTGTLFNSTATTVRIGEGATTAISIGSTGGTGTTTVNHALTVSRTLTASSTVSLSPANANVTISPTGTGTLTVNPAGTTNNFNNIIIGATTPKSATFTSDGSYSVRIRGVSGDSLFLTESSNGTLASPTQSLSGDTLLSVSARGYTGSAFSGGANLSFVTTENITAGNQGTKIALNAVPNGGTARVELSWNGSVLTSANAFTLGTAGTLITLAGNISATTNNQTVVLSPSGTGTVAISPVGALTINPTAASTMNNVAIGGTTTASAKFTTLDASGQVQFTAGTAAGNGTGTVLVTGGMYLSGAIWAAASSTLAGLSSTSTTNLSPANATVTISPTGTGTVTIAPGTTAGTIDRMNIGATTRGTGAFTTLAANSTVSFTGGTTSTSPTTGQLQVTGGVGISENLNVGGALIVTGNLTVNGTTTTINSSALAIDDKNIELASIVSQTGVTGNITSSATTTTITGMSTTSGMIPGQAVTRTAGTGAFGTGAVIASIDSASQITVTASTANTAGTITFSTGNATDITADGAGLTVLGATNKTLTYVNSSTSWTSNQNFDIASTRTYKINTTDVLSATAVLPNAATPTLGGVSTTGVTIGGAATTTVALGTNTSALTTVTVGGAITNNVLKIASTAGGIANLTTDVTTGTVNLFTSVTTGTVNLATGGAATAINIGTGGASAVNLSGTAGSVNIGTITGNSTLTVRGNGTSGTAAINTNVTTGTVNLMAALTTGTLTVGSAAAGRLAIAFNQASTSTTTGALTVAGGVGISGALYATTKSFDIPHPTKLAMGLRHGSLEGPEFGVYVRGRLSGNTVIELPEYWLGLVDADSITVQLTSVGRYQQLYVDSIENNKVTVADNLGGEIECFYTVWAERKDVDKLEVEYDNGD